MAFEKRRKMWPVKNVIDFCDSELNKKNARLIRTVNLKRIWYSKRKRKKEHYSKYGKTEEKNDENWFFENEKSDWILQFNQGQKEERKKESKKERKKEEMRLKLVWKTTTTKANTLHV